MIYYFFKKTFKFLILGFFAAAPFGALQAKVYRVGFEPFPPLALEKSGGLTEEILNAAASKIENVEFSYERATYKRLKYGLKHGNFDLIGHTPYQKEVKSFYEYAVELNWNIPVCTEFLFVNPEFKRNFKPKKIGTLTGNKDYLKELKGMDRIEVFEHSSMVSLLMMLDKKRLDAVWFATAVNNYYLKKFSSQFPELKPFRKSFPEKPLAIGLAVKKSKEGLELKQKLDKALNEITEKKIFDKKLEKLGFFSSDVCE